MSKNEFSNHQILMELLDIDILGLIVAKLDIWGIIGLYGTSWAMIERLRALLGGHWGQVVAKLLNYGHDGHNLQVVLLYSNLGLHYNTKDGKKYPLWPLGLPKLRNNKMLMANFGIESNSDLVEKIIEYENIESTWPFGISFCYEAIVDLLVNEGQYGLIGRLKEGLKMRLAQKLQLTFKYAITRPDVWLMVAKELDSCHCGIEAPGDFIKAYFDVAYSAEASYLEFIERYGAKEFIRYVCSQGAICATSWKIRLSWKYEKMYEGINALFFVLVANGKK
jgi:hypothetical protein